MIQIMVWHSSTITNHNKAVLIKDYNGQFQEE